LVDIISVFRRTTARQPSHTFAFDSTITLDYRGADERSDAIAATLIEHGIASGDRLGLCAGDSVPLLLTILGAWKAGALPALIDPRIPEADLPYFIGDIDAKLVAGSPGLRDRLEVAGAREFIDLSDLAQRPSTRERLPSRHDSDAPLYLSYTSGTTGSPKGAVLASGPVTLGTACIADRLGLTQSDVILATTPTSSSFQLVSVVMPAIHVGASVGLVAGLSAEKTVAVGRERKGTILVAYPLTLSDVVNLGTAGSCDFRLALSGGSPLAPRIKRDYRDRLGIPLVESYGQSELGGFMALGRLPLDERAFAGFVGPPLPDRRAFVGDPNGVEAPAGQWGEIFVPHGFFQGYRNKPEATSEALAGGVLHTGDVGVADPDGYIKVLGRTRERADAERRGGFLRDLEDAYYEHPDVKHAAVVSDSQGAIESFVELQTGRVVSPDELTDFAASRVPEGVSPDRTTVLQTMPRSFSGKADRRRLELGLVA
jgi:long-chain acyl-CoA synthetase